ncbi:STAS domain-containing protein [Parageobacillus sp. VR-IP]|uniref:STAS domain-containing protein n=1 Tax=Parageobacillus sp. VR-IP TaxID=2742205 RepID=UPI00158221B9|nr:STAS domain-containing protein [Parageobacillus sp. VR-IP]NUK31754.1 STAS domain-containing protein [Parageobacillus sp. VR-IP]
MRTKHGAIHVFTWNEDITLNNTEQFRKAMAKLIEEPADHLILNMEQVKYINSAGLGIIADGVMTARKQQKELVVAGVQGSLQEIFRIVKFSSFIKLFKTEKEAIHYFVENDNI